VNAGPADVVATVAHELQAPLAAVRAAARTLAESAPGDPKARARLLRIVLDGVDELDRLVDDLLTAARLDAGALRPEPVRCDAVAVAREAIQLAGAAGGDDRRTRLVAERDAGPALADPRWLRQVVTNLLTNGLAHGRGTVTVTVESRAGRLRISVSDEGPGVPAADLERIFDRYARLPGGSVRGTGLGLAIARELTEAMGGTVAAVPHRSGGTVFVVELPAAPDPD
jgi:two-component system sensor histidine kinase KdpD